MSDPVEIVEIGERPLTGVSSCPFCCRGADGYWYFVKLGNALPEEKINEWIFGYLAAEMGLPTPEGRVVRVGKDISAWSGGDTTEFGYGEGYGSREFASSNDIEFGQVESVNSTLQTEVLLFDWWIRNEDRKLGALGGNPNLLINQKEEVVLIDHGNAMDSEFSPQAFWEDHAFRNARKFLTNSEFQREWTSRAQKALQNIESRWEAASVQWIDDNSVLTLDAIKETLVRPLNESEQFWEAVSE